MKMSDAFPSKWLKASDLGGHSHKLTINQVVMEDLNPTDSKPIVYFKDRAKGLVLNKVNGSMIASLYGDDTDAWTGKEVEVYPDQVMFQGSMVPCIRVRGVITPAELDDVIPFN